MIVRRHPIIEQALTKKHSILVLGPRGSGKTYFLSRLLEGIPRKHVINLLNSTEYRKYLNKPALLYDEVKYEIESNGNHILHIMIDEVQLVPALMAETHRILDQFKSKVVFILTGSSARKLKNAEVDLLASRAISTRFFPFTSEEIDFKKQLSEVISYGTLPEIITTNDSWLMKQKLETYVGTYLNEEIKKETEIRNLEGFNLFLEYAAHSNGTTINYSKIARLVGVTAPTVKEYFNVLVDTLIVTEVPAWTYSIKRKLASAPKFYFFDNGLLNALTKEGFGPLKESSYLYGKLFENLIVNEIIRRLYLANSVLRAFHYRTERGREIDLILQKNAFSNPIAVEIKSAESPDLTDVPELEKFTDDYPNCRAFVLCRTDRSYKQGNIRFVNYLEGLRILTEIE